MAPKPAQGKVLIWNGEREDGHLTYMYHPVVWTLREGLQAIGCNVSVGSGIQRSLHRSLNSLSLGDSFIFVGSADHNALPWDQLRKRQIRTIYYNTEPFGCLKGLGPVNVDEVWDYSWANVDRCVAAGKFRKASNTSTVLDFSKQKIIRYVPPGAIKGSPQVVNFGKFGRGRGWTFLGRADASQARLGCFRTATAGLQRGRDFFETSNVWSNKTFRDLIQSSNGPSIFLSIHKNCNRAGMPFEALRGSLLLSAGALLISERSYTKDMNEYRGMVNFAPAGRALREAATAIMVLSADEREVRARRANAAFQSRFSPLAIIKKARVFDVIHPQHQ